MERILAHDGHRFDPVFPLSRRIFSVAGVAMTGDNNGICQRCGGTNPVWFVDSDRWNLAMGDDKEMIVCPGCFVKAHEKVSGMHTVWKLEPSEPFRYHNIDITYSPEANGRVIRVMPTYQIVVTKDEISYLWACSCGVNRYFTPGSVYEGEMLGEAKARIIVLKTARLHSEGYHDGKAEIHSRIYE